MHVRTERIDPSETVQCKEQARILHRRSVLKHSHLCRLNSHHGVATFRPLN